MWIADLKIVLSFCICTALAHYNSKQDYIRWRERYLPKRPPTTTESAVVTSANDINYESLKLRHHSRFPNLDRVMQKIDDMQADRKKNEVHPMHNKIRHQNIYRTTTTTTTTTDEGLFGDDYDGDLEYDNDDLNDYDDWEDENDDLDDNFDDYEDEAGDDPFSDDDNEWQAEEATEPTVAAPVSSLTKYKWDNYGTRPRVEESRRQQLHLKPFNEGSATNAVIDHYMKVRQEGQCRKPLPKVVSVQSEHPNPSKTYTPHCTILHRCAEDTGCCANLETKCGPKTQVPVHLYFYEGKRREYNLGRFLRQRYDKYLGDVYLPGLIYARSTDFDRTKMSLQLVLAGLFPPKGNQYWLYPLHWQPIPYNYEQPQRDKLLTGVLACPSYVKYLLENENSEQVQKVFKHNYNILDYIANNTGCKSTNLISASLLYFTLETEDEWGFVLSNWTTLVYPELLQRIVSDWYLIASGTNKMKQITSGYLLQKILRDTQMKIEGRVGTKIFLYSGHDNNIAFLLNTLGVFQPHVPPYGACILIEVHNIEGQYAVKVIYENYKNIQSGTLTIPGCEEVCPLENFRALVQNYLPDEAVCGTNDLSKPVLTTLLDTVTNLYKTK